MYRLKKDGMKYTLLPLKTKLTLPVSSTFLTMTQNFEEKIKENRQIHALIVKQALMNEAELHMEEQPKAVHPLP